MGIAATEHASPLDMNLLENKLVNVKEVLGSKAPDRPYVVYDKEDHRSAVLVHAQHDSTVCRVWDRGRGEFASPFFYAIREGEGRLIVGHPYYSGPPKMSIPLERVEARLLAMRYLVNEEPDRVVLTRHQSYGCSEYLDNLTEELHDIANNQDWCNEFDDLMEQVGLDTRSKDYISTVRATVEVTLPGQGRVEGAITDAFPSVSCVGSIRATMDVTVDVPWTGRSGDEDHYVDISEVENAVSYELDTVDVEDVEDWEIVDTNLAD